MKKRNVSVRDAPTTFIQYFKRCWLNETITQGVGIIYVYTSQDMRFCSSNNVPPYSSLGLPFLPLNPRWFNIPLCTIRKRGLGLSYKSIYSSVSPYVQLPVMSTTLSSRGSGWLRVKPQNYALPFHYCEVFPFRRIQMTYSCLKTCLGEE